MKIRQMKNFLRFSLFALLICGPVAMLCGADLLVADIHGDPNSPDPNNPTPGRVLAFDPATGSYVSTVADGLTLPSSLTIGPGGYLYVSDQATNSVQVYDPTGQNVKITNAGLNINNGVFASSTTLNGPGGLLYNPSVSSSLFVSELGGITTFNGQNIYKFDPNGSVTALTSPDITGWSGMTFDSQGNLFASSFDGAIVEFTESSNYASSSIFASGSALLGASQLLFHGGNLFVAAQLGGGSSGTVDEIDSQGHVTALISGLAFDSGLYDDGQGHLLVTQLGGGTSPGSIGEYDFSGNTINANYILGFDTPLETDDPGFSFIVPSTVISVPEPASLVMAFIGLMILAGCYVRQLRAGPGLCRVRLPW
jgi:hypothetical protein